jgi:cytochrome P450
MDFMQNQAAERKAEIRAGITEGKEDVFTMLVKANEGEAGKSQLDDEELVSSVPT